MILFTIRPRLITAGASVLSLLVLVLVSGCGSSKQTSNPEPGLALETVDPLYTFRVSLNLTTHSGPAQTTRIAVAPGGNVYAFDMHSDNYTADLVRFTNYGRGSSQVLTQINSPNIDLDPTPAISPRTGNLYVTENDGITIFSNTTGERIGKLSAHIVSGGVYYPYNIAIDSSGILYMVDGNNVVRYDSNGNLLSSLSGHSYSGNTQTINISPNNVLYIEQDGVSLLAIDTSGKTLFDFTPDLSHLYKGGGGIGRSLINAAGEVLVKNIFVDEMDKFSATGTLLRCVKMRGDLGACDDQGRIYVEASDIAGGWHIDVYPPL